jgi:hypothetical protein
LLKLDDGEAEPLVTLLSENFWLTPGGSTARSELPLLMLVLEGSELLLELKEGSELLLTLELEGFTLLLLTLAGSTLLLLFGSIVDEKSSVGETPNTGDNTLSLRAPSGVLLIKLVGAATAGITKAAANTTTKTPTMITRRTVSSLSRNH